MNSYLQANSKNKIFYSREYRHLQKPSARSLIFLCLCVLPVCCVFLFLYPEITSILSDWGAAILRATTGTTVTVETVLFIPWVGDVSYISLEGTTPTFTSSLINAVASLLFILIASQTNRSNRPLMIYLCMGLFVHLVSSLFFIFFPEYFPYSLVDYSKLYILQQIGTWLTIALISGAATDLILSKGGYKYAAFFITVLYSFIFGCVRYVVYLFILYKFSLLYMAMLFFIFGVLYDFLGMIAIYALYVRSVSDLMSSKSGREAWRW